MKKNKETLKEYWENRDEIFEKDKKNYNGPHCCLSTHLAVDKSDPENISPDYYNPKFRAYYLKAVRGHGAEQIYFCPRCGKKYPKELSEEWFDILEKEYHINDPLSNYREQAPTEFDTDEWWKKRGL